MLRAFDKLLFCFSPEAAHDIALKSLGFAHQVKLTKLLPSCASTPQTIMGLTFPNPVGLAAGFDKNGDYIDALFSLGFGFMEIGTVTPRPQAGNPRPRIFRLPEHQAIINQLGFNNKGMEHVAGRLEKRRSKGILGINIGKNRDTPLENAIEDYVSVFRCVAAHASYVTINISSPNTPELRKLQHNDFLPVLLNTLKDEQAAVIKTQKKYVPLVVKISPDLTTEELHNVAENLLVSKIEGVIASNTTIKRDGIQGSTYKNQPGGLSGGPLNALSTKMVKDLHGLLQNKIPIIASGGVVSEKAALEKLAAGAVLVQVYTGLIYQGPWWVSRLVGKLQQGLSNLALGASQCQIGK